MLDCYQIDYIIRKKNYCLWKITDASFDIIKNESGTYGEYCDFTINMNIDAKTSLVKKWKINAGTISKECMQEIEVKIKDIIDRSDMLFEHVCFAIADQI
jgi:hypothetical protein